jgi:hypothetical protein
MTEPTEKFYLMPKAAKLRQPRGGTRRFISVRLMNHQRSSSDQKVKKVNGQPDPLYSAHDFFRNREMKKPSLSK